jgi:hypothetical protein
MKLSSFAEMIKDYEVRPIDSDDFDEREELFKTHKYSVIFEAEFLEFENVEKWINEELNLKELKCIFYGKLDYNYGFFEIFFLDESTSTKLEAILPTIYTKYPNGQILKTNGSDNFIYKGD